MIPETFFTWADLASYAGATMASPITPSVILLCLINAVLVAMAAIGGYHTVADVKDKL